MMLDEINELKARLNRLEEKLLGAPSPAIAIVQPTAQPAQSTNAVKPSFTYGNLKGNKLQTWAPLASRTPMLIPPVTSASAKPDETAEAPVAKTPAEPFAFADWTWLTGNSRTTESPMDTKFFTPEIRADVDYVYDYNHPADHTIGGSSEVFRAGEVQLTQLGVGGDFHW